MFGSAPSATTARSASTRVPSASRTASRRPSPSKPVDAGPEPQRRRRARGAARRSARRRPGRAPSSAAARRRSSSRPAPACARSRRPRSRRSRRRRRRAAAARRARRAARARRRGRAGRTRRPGTSPGQVRARAPVAISSFAVRQPLAVAQQQLAAREVEPGRRRPEPPLDVEVVARQRGVLGLLRAAEQLLGERRARVGQVRLVADHDDPAARAPPCGAPAPRAGPRARRRR